MHEMAVASDFPELRAQYPFVSRRLALPHASMHYVDEGVGPPVLMVHGNPTWSFFFRDLIRGLRADRRAIALDHIGCGLSSKPQQYRYTLDQHIENLGRLVAALGLDEVDLVVHDWGGAIGFGAAARGLFRVRRAVVFNTAAFRAPNMPLRIAALRAPGIGPWAIQYLNAFALPATRMTTVRPLSAATRAGYLLPYGTPADRIAVRRFVEDIPMDASHPTWATLAAIEARLPTFASTPMLIAWGGQDWCFDDLVLAGWRQRFPQAQVHRFDDAGHYLLDDAADRIVPLVARFLAEEQ